MYPAWNRGYRDYDLFIGKGRRKPVHPVTIEAKRPNVKHPVADKILKSIHMHSIDVLYGSGKEGDD